MFKGKPALAGFFSLDILWYNKKVIKIISPAKIFHIIYLVKNIN